MAVSAWSSVVSRTTGIAHARTPSDAATLADGVSRGSAYTWGTQDYALTDVVVFEIPNLRLVLNDMQISDVLEREFTAIRALADAIALADLMSHAAGRGLAFADLAAPVDALIREVTNERHVFDLEALVDHVSVEWLSVDRVTSKHPGRELLVYREDVLIGQLLSTGPLGSTRRVRNITRFGAPMMNYDVSVRDGGEVELRIATDNPDPARAALYADYLARTVAEYDFVQGSAGEVISFPARVVGVWDASPLDGLYTFTARIRIVAPGLVASRV